MNRLWIVTVWILCAGLWGCKGAEPTTQAPAATPAPERPEEQAPAQAQVEDPPLEAARRERAGIDLGSTKSDDSEIDGRRPAARLIAPPNTAAPARLEGDQAQGAKAARAFVLGPWKSAVEDKDNARFVGLLHDAFTGMNGGGGSPSPVQRSAWPEARGGLGQPVTLSNLSVAMVKSPKGDSTVTFHEHAGVGDACSARTRELTLGLDEKEQLRVRVVTASEGGPCGEQRAGQVAAAHALLVKLWKDEDRLEAAGTTPSVWLRDHGLDVRTYDRDALHKGEGRWLMEALAGVEATEENTSQVGTVGEVRGAKGLVFSYHWTQDRWTLQGLDRVE